MVTHEVCGEGVSLHRGGVAASIIGWQGQALYTNRFGTQEAGKTNENEQT